MKKQMKRTLDLDVTTIRRLQDARSVAGGRRHIDTEGASCGLTCGTTTGDSATCYSNWC